MLRRPDPPDTNPALTPRCGRQRASFRRVITRLQPLKSGDAVQTAPDVRDNADRRRLSVKTSEDGDRHRGGFRCREGNVSSALG